MRIFLTVLIAAFVLILSLGDSSADQENMSDCPCFEEMEVLVNDTMCVDDLSIAGIVFEGGRWGWWFSDPLGKRNNNAPMFVTEITYYSQGTCSLLTADWAEELDSFSGGYCASGIGPAALECTSLSVNFSQLTTKNEQMSCESLIGDLYLRLSDMNSCE